MVLTTHAWSQDSLNMTRVGQWNPSNMPTSSGVTYNDVWGYTAPTGEEYAIVGNVDSILIVDISDCENPVRVYGFDGGNTVVWRDFKTYGDYVYGVCDSCNEGLHIFNMSALPNGAVTHELTTTAFFNNAHNIWIDEPTAKLYATGTNTANEGVVILDLANPADPTLIQNVEFDDEIGLPNLNFYVHDIYVRNDTAYASHGWQGYYVWDMSNLSNITLLGDFDEGGYNHSSWTTQDGAYAYFAEEVPTGRPMVVLDLANLGSMTSNISKVTTFENALGTLPNATPHNPFIKNDTLYISYYEDGIKVYDLTNPAAPAYVGYYDTYPDNGTGYNGYNGAWGTYPFFDSGCICVSDIDYGLNILRNCVTQAYYQDADGDGYGNAAVTITQCGAPTGFVSDNTDCDDTDPDINPGAPELCDGIDNNCNNLIDEGVLITYYLDLDEDGFGGLNNTVESCTPIAGYITTGGDCDDNNDEIYPNAIEICDGQDNNCDGQIDEGLQTTYYEDLDNDSYGNPTVSMMSCFQPSGYVLDNTDCDDSTAATNPGAVETCDGLDNNCDGQVDEGLAFVSYYEDLDGDGYGNNMVTLTACSPPTGFVLDNTDCDDSVATINPGAIEICDGIDNNCDGQIDEGVATQTYYEDMDGDSYGNASVFLSACSQPIGYVLDSTDCEDTDSSIHPGSPELCDNMDNNCNGQIDEGLASQTYYEDSDGDTYGNASVSLSSCSQPAGYVLDSSDCDDIDATINPSATEACDGIDNNCDGQIDEGCALDPCDAIQLFISTISQDTFRAKQLIESDAHIIATDDIIYRAGQEIALLPGFEVGLGAEFLAHIVDCELSSNTNIFGPANLNEILGFMFSEKSDNKFYHLISETGKAVMMNTDKTEIQRRLKTMNSFDKFFLISIE